MGKFVIIYGRSGTGKSRSLKNFSKDELTLINVEGKELPFRGKFKYTLVSDDVETIKTALQTMPTKSAVIDDCGYIMTHRFMRDHREMTGNKQFIMYNDIADDIYGLIRATKNLPDDKIVYFIFHEDMNDNGITIIRTLGKLLDNKVCIEGMATIVLHSMFDGQNYYFKTQNNGTDVAKSPEGMFDAVDIPNDLKAVDDAIRAYYAEEEK